MTEVKTGVVSQIKPSATLNDSDRKKKVAAFFDKIAPRLDYLGGRWADEHEYEDFNDYKTEMEKLVKKHLPGATFVKASKRPLGFEMTFAGATYRFKVTSASVSYGRLL